MFFCAVCVAWPPTGACSGQAAPSAQLGVLKLHKSPDKQGTVWILHLLHTGMPPALQLHTQTLLMTSCLCDLNLICVLKWGGFAFCLFKSTYMYNLSFSFFLQVFLLIQSEKIKSDFVYLSWLARCCESLYFQHCRIQILLYCVSPGNPLS